MDVVTKVDIGGEVVRHLQTGLAYVYQPGFVRRFAS